MKTILVLLLAMASAMAETNFGFMSFTNKTGHFIERAEVYKVDDQRAFYRLTAGTGGGSVMLADLPDNLQTRFGYGTTPIKSDQHRIEAFQAAYTNSVELKFTSTPTIKLEPFWKPTEGQLNCGQLYFSTEVNEFDRVIVHRLFNLDDDIGTVIVYSYSPDTVGLGTYELMVICYSKRRQSFSFDPEKPIEFIIDGLRYSFADARTVVTKPRYDTNLRQYTQYYHCNMDENCVRNLGKAERASMRVPTDLVPLDHVFSAVELRRFRLFAQNFLPNPIAVRQ